MNSTLVGRKAVVIGGGWSGIASAWYLQRAGADVELIEAHPELGGRSRSVVLGERAVTLGGKNVGKKYRRFRRFVSEHGGTGWEHFGISTSQIHNGKVVTIEGNRRGSATLRMLSRARPTEIFQLLRYARALAADEANRFLDGPVFMRATRSGDPPMSDVFSTHLVANLIRPMTIRMNGAEPDEAYLGNLGTNLALVLDSFDQLTDGFEPVLARFASTTTIRTGNTATEIRPTATGTTIHYRSPEGGTGSVDADAVVIAIPAHEAAELVRPLHASAARTLDDVPYHPVGVVVAEYDKDVFGETGRALVFPEGHAISNAGAYGKGDLRTVRYTFSGRAARKTLERSPSQDELLRVGERELSAYLPIGNATAIGVVSQVWERGLCSYGPKHNHVTHRLRTAGTELGGVAFAGDYMAGASIEACFVSAERAVDALSGSIATSR